MSKGGATSRKPSGYNRDNLGVQVEALRQTLERWFSADDRPPSLAPTLIQFILFTAKAGSFEKAFLAAFCHHSGDEHAERYSVVVERAVELGVYPLPLVEDPDGHVATEPAVGEPQALFDDFSLEEASSTPVEIIEPEGAAEPALDEATGALDRSSRDEDEAKATRVNESAAVAASDASRVLANPSARAPQTTWLAACAGLEAEPQSDGESSPKCARSRPTRFLAPVRGPDSIDTRPASASRVCHRKVRLPKSHGIVRQRTGQ
ncbi:MAG: hypothetical protein Q7T08_04740 [Devosia sp.]|nr:hypothetical protein [Devosia sp.]